MMSKALKILGLENTRENRVHAYNEIVRPYCVTMKKSFQQLFEIYQES
jgi:hypothetical protein